ncbi:RHS repeat-associated core domain-containing protein [Streptomyces sp. 372A]
MSERQAGLLLGEGRHPDADRIERQLMAARESPARAWRATVPGRPIEHNASEETEKAKKRIPWPAMDLVFRPPPTAHIAWELCDDEHRRVLELCQEVAQDKTLEWLESSAAQIRWGSGGKHRRPIRGGLIVACITTGSMDTGFVREPGGTLNSMTRRGKSYYYLTDATGNILGAVDQAGTRTHTYTPTETVPQPYRFAGACNDPTGLYEMGARYYDPTLGRFTQPDPSGQETTTYLYGAGDPINHTDPSGLLALDRLGPVGDVVQAGYHAWQGDTQALWCDGAGFAAGAAVGWGCEAVLGITAAPTLGAAEAGGQPMCYAASWGAGTAVGNLVGG